MLYGGIINQQFGDVYTISRKGGSFTLKKKYTTPEMEITEFESEDVIATSLPIESGGETD